MIKNTIKHAKIEYSVLNISKAIEENYRETGIYIENGRHKDWYIEK